MRNGEQRKQIYFFLKEKDQFETSAPIEYESDNPAPLGNYDRQTQRSTD